MTKPKALSPTMSAVLKEAVDFGGRLVRLPGGYWTYPGCPWAGSAPSFNVGTKTIEGLRARGHLVYTEWKRGKSGWFPIAAALSAEVMR